jgi:hypothetical protein
MVQPFLICEFLVQPAEPSRRWTMGAYLYLYSDPPPWDKSLFINAGARSFMSKTVSPMTVTFAPGERTLEAMLSMMGTGDPGSQGTAQSAEFLLDGIRYPLTEQEIFSLVLALEAIQAE